MDDMFRNMWIYTAVVSFLLYVLLLAIILEMSEVLKKKIDEFKTDFALLKVELKGELLDLKRSMILESHVSHQKGESGKNQA